MIPRRLLLAGGGAIAAATAVGAGYELVEAGILPGKYRLDAFLGACGSDPELPRVAAGPVVARTFLSRYRRRRVQMLTMLPPGRHRHLPVVLVLHGAGASAAGCMQLGYPWFLASGRVPPMALVAADGGAASWWHRRADGDDPQGMLVNEVLPYLAAQGFRTERIGMTGWSMGGFGSLLLAERSAPNLIAAVSASSPAIYPSYSDAVHANAGSFDNSADFARNDVRAASGIAALRRRPVMIDCGSDDAFSPVVSRFRNDLGNPAGTIDSGCHDAAYWRRHIPDQLAFLAAHLA